MDIGIGLPNTIPGATGAQLLEWSRRADAAGFSSLSSIGAVSYPGYEELTAFAAAGVVTERIRLFPNVLIAPARSAAELAKQAASVDQLTGGRLSLGLAVGWRSSDYQLTGRSFEERGRLFDEQLRDLRKAWAGEPLEEGTREVGPAVVQEGGPPMIIGGAVDATVRRVVEFGVGWTAGGSPPDAVAAFGDKVRRAWKEAGRAGQPRIVAAAYFGMGDDVGPSRGYILDYYRPMGAETAEMIAGFIGRSPEALQGAVAAYTEAGADELIFYATLSDPAQVDMLAEAVL